MKDHHSSRLLTQAANPESTATNGKPADPLLDIRRPEGRTDVANGRRFAALYADRARYCHAWKCWLIWDGKRWQIDDTGAAPELAKRLTDRLWREARNAGDQDAAKFAAVSSSSQRTKATLEMASSELGMTVRPEQMDADAWALNCRNGTLDLRNGQLRPHSREDMLTKLCPVEFDPEATSPRWTEFWQVVLGGNVELIGYVQRLVGYSITGTAREHILPFAYGTGQNGKSVFLNTCLALLGRDYAMKAPHDMLLSSSRDKHPTHLADLHGKRFVACVEADDGRRLP